MRQNNFYKPERLYSQKRATWKEFASQFEPTVGAESFAKKSITRIFLNMPHGVNGRSAFLVNTSPAEDFQFEQLTKVPIKSDGLSVKYECAGLGKSFSVLAGTGADNVSRYVPPYICSSNTDLLTIYDRADISGKN